MWIPTGSYNVTITAKRQGMLVYTCEKCQRQVLYQWPITCADTGTYHALQRSETKQKVTDETREKAKDQLDKKDEMLFEEINSNRNYAVLPKTLRCPHCHAAQSWSRQLKPFHKTSWFVLWIVLLLFFSVFASAIFWGHALLRSLCSLAVVVLFLATAVVWELRRKKIREEVEQASFAAPLYYNSRNIELLPQLVNVEEIARHEDFGDKEIKRPEERFVFIGLIVVAALSFLITMLLPLDADVREEKPSKTNDVAVSSVDAEESSMSTREIVSTTEYEAEICDGKATITEWLSLDAKMEIPETISGCPVVALSDLCLAKYQCTELSIPKTLESFGEDFFRDADKLTTIVVDEDNEHFTVKDGALYSKDMKVLYRAISSNAVFAVPATVTTIGNFAFVGGSQFTSITLPDSVETVGTCAFKDCVGLLTMDISHVKKFGLAGFGTFEGCSALTRVSLPQDMQCIGFAQFKNCESLLSIDIPESVTAISQSAFSGCSSLTSVDLPDGVTEVMDHAFSGCSTLEQISIPDGVTEIETGTFNECLCLQEITLPDSLQSIGETAFRACLSLKTISIPDSVTRIGNDAFLGCGNLEKAIESQTDLFTLDTEDVTIQCSKGSYAEQYASANNLNVEY